MWTQCRSKWSRVACCWFLHYLYYFVNKLYWLTLLQEEISSTVKSKKLVDSQYWPFLFWWLCYVSFRGAFHDAFLWFLKQSHADCKRRCCRVLVVMNSCSCQKSGALRFAHQSPLKGHLTPTRPSSKTNAFGLRGVLESSFPLPIPRTCLRP